MGLHFDNEKVSPKMKAIATSLWSAGKLKDVYTDDYSNPEKELAIRNFSVDYYLLSVVLAERIAAGDLELIERGDSTGLKQYCDRLIEEIVSHESKNVAESAQQDTVISILRKEKYLAGCFVRRFAKAPDSVNGEPLTINVMTTDGTSASYTIDSPYTISDPNAKGYINTYASFKPAVILDDFGSVEAIDFVQLT